MKRVLAVGIAAFVNIAVLATVGWTAARWYTMLPVAYHGAALTGGSILAGALIAISLQLLGKLDALLRDAAMVITVRTGPIFRYVGKLRRRIVIWVFAALFGLIVAAAGAYVLNQAVPLHVRWTVCTGYVALTVVALSAIRVISAYLRIDGFQLEIRKQMEDEKLRAETVRQMRAASQIKEFPAQTSL
jgi:hypothetical protein